MAAITMQKDLVVAFKKETYLNVGILSKLQPMPGDLTRQVFKENALEKPTQAVFNNLSYYLVCIIDAKASSGFSWPLYDTKTERAYRNELSGFINDYSSKGLLSPVMSSYLVNPSCYKVTMLIFQLSQLAVQRVLLTKMKKNRQRELYDDMTVKYKQNREGFMENIELETDFMLSKFSNYLHKRKSMEQIAEILRGKIKEIEAKLVSLNCQKYIDDLVDKYLENHNIDQAFKDEILKIKDINSTPKIFDDWFDVMDREMDRLESEWDRRISPLLEMSRQSRECTELLINRHTGEADKSSYTIEFDPNTDDICTKDLQEQVNSQQKYILRNIIKENKLSFPNLIRGFLISISFILKNAEIGDEIFKFNEYLNGGRRSYKEIVSSMRILTERVFSAEARLEPSSLLVNESLSIKELAEIPPIPDLSDLKANRDLHSQMLFDTLTPFSVSKHQFNLLRKNSYLLSKNQPKSLLSGSFQPPRDDFLKSLISCRVSTYDQSNASNINNISIISQVTQKNNETIAECTSGFTKQQILRLLSTKKSSSSKKFKYKTERPNINVKRGGLFNESNVSNESCGLFRSHSSPNLYENREKRSMHRLHKRKLSIMQEDSPSILEVSGISRLEKENSYGTPQSGSNSDKYKNFNNHDTTSITVITMTNEAEKMITIFNKIESELKEVEDFSPVFEEERKSELQQDSKLETPKTNPQLIKKTSSLEKIINRFKKIKANVVSEMSREEAEFNTIVEEKENYNTVNVDVFTANKVLLPDLLSPSCSVLSAKSGYLDQLCFDMDETDKRKPRESLGTALGVDQTFLDQFDLID
ncbi:uncharacterized protein LOC128680460 [Plodia interpunctella]|uniref:uncharacterized protein LOC128680460 n=1 Tax=Plodia interpunctella TaxID=58824 RepID=UPI00236897EA|nr:uncharacterized protein LOC128680460 [Plodia interpunctella]